MTSLMLREAGEAADAVRRQAADAAAIAAVVKRLRGGRFHSVATCARGSSNHAATYAKYLIETRLGLLVSSASPSVSSLYGSAAADDLTLGLAISQAGGSPDLLATLEAMRRAGATTLALVNAPDSPLAAAAHLHLPLNAGPEQSVAATKSYIASLAMIARLVAMLTEDADLLDAIAALPVLLEAAWRADWSPLVDALRDRRGLYVIGRGYGLGIAQEAALKLKEVCGLHAEAFSAAEVRHGPWALVGPDLPLLVFRQGDETEAGVDALTSDAIERGATVLVADGAPHGAIALPCPSAHPVIEPILQIQAFYQAGEALARARGFDPDHPPNLRKVTETL